MSDNSIVVLISADQEWRTVIDWYQPQETFPSPYGNWFNQTIDEADPKSVVRFFHGGWGKVAAAGSTQYAISEWQPNLFVNLGTCGGFRGFTNVGEIILVDETMIYDIYEQMLEAETAIDAYRTNLDLSWLNDPYPQKVTRTRMVSADRDLISSEIDNLHNRYGAIAGDWESGSIAYVASKNNIRCLILRGVSDLVDRQGSEAYQNAELFGRRVDLIMTDLLRNLSAWLVQSA